MAIKYLKPGQDFHEDPSAFSKDFGFTGSAVGRHDARSHPQGQMQDDYGDGGYPGIAAKAKGGSHKARKGYDMGGTAMPGTPPVPSPQSNPSLPGALSSGALPGQRPMPPAAPVAVPTTLAARAAQGAFKIGQVSGARQGAQLAARRMAGNRPMPPGHPPMPEDAAAMKAGGHMTAKKRNALPDSSFAGPDRSYPINDENHARSALSRVAQHGDPSLQKKVRAAVHRRYPSIGEK